VIRVKIGINNSLSLTDIYAVRVRPTNRKPEEGEICKYELFEYPKQEKLFDFDFPYGDADLLAVQMILIYRDWKNEKTKLE
jgi:hypothetical protein